MLLVPCPVFPILFGGWPPSPDRLPATLSSCPCMQGACPPGCIHVSEACVGLLTEEACQWLPTEGVHVPGPKGTQAWVGSYIWAGQGLKGSVSHPGSRHDEAAGVHPALSASQAAQASGNGHVNGWSCVPSPSLGSRLGLSRMSTCMLEDTLYRRQLSKGLTGAGSSENSSKAGPVARNRLAPAVAPAAAHVEQQLLQQQGLYRPSLGSASQAPQDRPGPMREGSSPAGHQVTAHAKHQSGGACGSGQVLLMPPSMQHAGRASAWSTYPSMHPSHASSSLALYHAGSPNRAYCEAGPEAVSAAGVPAGVAATAPAPAPVADVSAAPTAAAEELLEAETSNAGAGVASGPLELQTPDTAEGGMGGNMVAEPSEIPAAEALLNRELLELVGSSPTALYPPEAFSSSKSKIMTFPVCLGGRVLETALAIANHEGLAQGAQGQARTVSDHDVAAGRGSQQAISVSLRKLLGLEPPPLLQDSPLGRQRYSLDPAMIPNTRGHGCGGLPRRPAGGSAWASAPPTAFLVEAMDEYHSQPWLDSENVTSMGHGREGAGHVPSGTPCMPEAKSAVCPKERGGCDASEDELLGDTATLLAAVEGFAVAATAAPGPGQLAAGRGRAGGSGMARDRLHSGS